MNNYKFELISHHLCPFLHRTVILLERKGLKKNIDFKVTYVPIYDLPNWLYKISPKGEMPVLKFNDQKVLLHTVAINAFFDETIPPQYFPEDAYERALQRGLILSCGNLLNFMRTVYTTKDALVMENALGKLFSGIGDLKGELQTIIKIEGSNSSKMVECAFASLFTLMLNFDKIKSDSRWETMNDLKNYAEQLCIDPIVISSKCPAYEEEFDRFFNYFGSVFKLIG